MKKLVPLLLLIVVACSEPTQQAQTKESVLNTSGNYQFTYHDGKQFTLVGQLPGVSDYNRLPEIAKDKVRKVIWNISQESAGLSLRFRTNAKAISVKWRLKEIKNYPHISDAGVSGLDLYAINDTAWQFVGLAKPGLTLTNEALLADKLDGKETEYLLNLPLYNRVDQLEIGVNEGATITKGGTFDGSIVVYGTSITQGASASRPGMCYTALLQRNLNKNIINLGFSGEGKFEKELAPYMLSANPEIIIIDCTPNSSPEVIKSNAPAFIEEIRKFNPTVPILILESIIREDAYFKNDKYAFIQNQNQALKQVFDQSKDANLHYLPATDLIGSDHEGTVDGTHLNDIGFYRVYQKILINISQIKGK